MQTVRSELFRRSGSASIPRPTEPAHKSERPSDHKAISLFSDASGRFLGQASVGVLAFLALGMSLWIHLRLGDMAFDDTWIHLRIAKNLINTGHAFFNTNERVMVTSSPLWTLLLAVLKVPNRPSLLPVLEAFLFWGACMLACAGAWRSLYDQDRILRILLTIVAGLATASVLILSSVGQMETPLAIMLLLGAWLSALCDQSLSLPLLATAALTRLELVPVWAMVTIVAVALNRRRLQAALLGCGIMVAGASWTFSQFRVLLPNSMYAKRVVYDFGLSQVLSQFFPNRKSEYASDLLLLLLLSIACYLWGRSTSETRLRRIAMLAITSVVISFFVIAEYVVRHSVVFDWYRPLYLLPLALGLLVLPLPSTVSSVWRTTFAALGAIVVCHLLLRPLGDLYRTTRASVSPTILNKSKIDGGDFVRVKEYREVGLALTRTCPHQQLMVSEIGGLGWSYAFFVNDGFGIASPAALRFQPLRSGAPKGGIPAAYLLQSKPQIVVSYTMMAVEPLYDARVNKLYDLVQLPPSPRSARGGPLDLGWRNSLNLNVMLRRGGPCDTQAVRQALRSEIE